MQRLAIIAERLHLLRKRLRLTQAELATRIGVSQASVSSWERAQFAPGAIELAAVADLGAASMDWLSGRSDSLTGLHPGHFLVDLDVVDDPSRGREMWRVEIPKRHRIVDFREMQELETAMKQRDPHRQRGGSP